MTSTKSTSNPTETAGIAQGGLFRFVQIVAAMLIAARWLVPPEAAVFGDTIWIVQLWFLAVILWGWDAFRRYDYRVRLDWLDLAVGALVLGHVVSAIRVLGGLGNQRAALNLMWEWVGLGLSFFLLRQLLRTQTDGRRLIGLMLAAAVMLSGHGIWQHYVELPKLVEDYGQLAGQLAENPNDLKLQRELARLGVPASPAGRAVWENRLRSTEPFATFALANTLAGFLVAWLFVGMDLSGRSRIVSSERGRFDWQTAGRWIGLLLLAFCLVLTKSRTAWVGFLAGFLVWVGLRRSKAPHPNPLPQGQRGQDDPPRPNPLQQGERGQVRRWWIAAAGVVCLGVLLFAVAAASGGFDRQVLSEAPKSLAYRLQYWSGAWEVVKEQPWLGTGPGNFRQRYLHFKLPESSEEIADPHNWMLDLWTSGGLLALLGFVALIVLAVRAAKRPHLATNDEETRGVSSWELGAGLAFPAVMLALWLSGEPVRSSLVWLGGGWCLACWLFRKDESPLWPRAGILAGGLALLVHLLGAGGIEMPLIAQTILILVILLGLADWEVSPAISISRPKTVLAISLGAVIAFGLCLVSATMPNWYRSVYLASGDASFSENQNFPAAERFYRDALKADPYSPEPVERLAELAFRRWERSADDEEFERAVELAGDAIRLDPVSNHGYRRLGQWHFQRAKSRNSAADAAKAAEYFSEAVARYPNSAMLRAETALAFDLAGESRSAAEDAARALELDRINRQAGHRDKYLPADLLEELKRLAG